MKKQAIINFTFFLLISMGFTYFAGLFREANDKERMSFQVEIPQAQTLKKSLDIAKQGKLKYYLQPGQISIYVRGHVSTAVASNLQAEFCGIQGYVSQGSKKTEWREVKKEDFLKVRKNRMMHISIEMNIPRSKIMQYNVGSADLVFTSNGKKVAVIQFDIVNSMYKGDMIHRGF